MSQLMLRGHVLEPLLDIRRDFDRVFEHFFRHSAQAPQLSEALFAAVPLIESWVDEDDKEFHVTMPLPGFAPEEITIQVQGKTLILSAEHEEEADDSRKTFFEREISTQSFRRTIALPDGVDGEQLTANLSDGVLEITAPIEPSALPKKIPVKSEPKPSITSKIASKPGTPAKTESKTGTTDR